MDFGDDFMLGLKMIEVQAALERACPVSGSSPAGSQCLP